MIIIVPKSKRFLISMNQIFFLIYILLLQRFALYQFLFHKNFLLTFDMRQIITKFRHSRVLYKSIFHQKIKLQIRKFVKNYPPPIYLIINPNVFHDLKWLELFWITNYYLKDLLQLVINGSYFLFFMFYLKLCIVFANFNLINLKKNIKKFCSERHKEQFTRCFIKYL